MSIQFGPFDSNTFWKSFEQFADPDNKRNTSTKNEVLFSGKTYSSNFFPPPKNSAPVVYTEAYTRNGQLCIESSYDNSAPISYTDKYRLFIISFKNKIFDAVNQTKSECTFPLLIKSYVTKREYDDIIEPSSNETCPSVVWNLTRPIFENFLSSHLGVRCETRELPRSGAGKSELPLQVTLRWNLWNKKLEVPFLPSIPVVVPCDVGYGKALGFLCEPNWEKAPAAPLTWTPEGWSGAAPVDVKFKYVIADYESGKLLEWEQKEGNRFYERTVLVNDVKF